MAYLRPLIFFILAALAIFMLISPSHSSLDNANDKVTVSLYYETSLCPRCASFISNDLVKVFHTDLHTIINLRVSLDGRNAEIHCQVSNSILHFNVFSLLTNEVQFLSSTVTNYSLCNNVHHGEEECHLNTIHSCVIHFWPDVKEQLEFIGCTEQQSLKGGPSKHCGKIAEIINKCYTTGFGYKLPLQYANETAHLKPPQEYVPWVVVNHQPLRQVITSIFISWLHDFENFVKYVCQAYKGDHKSAACKAQSSNLSPTIYALPQPPVIPVVDFYKLALQWPPSVYSSTLNCKLPIPTEFKIHGIWAQDAHDTPVPPYDTHHPYTNPQPMTSQSDLRQLLVSDVALWNQLLTLSPNLASTGSGIGFWFKEWMKHGTSMGLTRGFTYTVRQVADIVFRLIGASPQISCSKHRRARVLLLGEMFIYYGRPRPSHNFGTPQNCSSLFYGLCSSGSDTIEFP
ncbi:hypothetical protein ES288_D10G300700v1 [Gossypium darwinii]|uniref:Uncharacterized protein n=1 Tax=Gossypium darwinii TaxID=34276 RepID=A0A5D2B611_GOSDA|nr:hypothetical protein ES288_D10G300700v1 [Gossypium darwinii]